MMRHVLDELGNLHAVSRIKAGVNFIEHVKRHGIALLDGKNQSKGDNALLTTRKQEIVHGLTIIDTRKRHFDTDSGPGLWEASAKNCTQPARKIAYPLFATMNEQHKFAGASRNNDGENFTEMLVYFLEEIADLLIFIVIQFLN